MTKRRYRRWRGRYKALVRKHAAELGMEFRWAVDAWRAMIDEALRETDEVR